MASPCFRNFSSLLLLLEMLGHLRDRVMAFNWISGEFVSAALRYIYSLCVLIQAMFISDLSSLFCVLFVLYSRHEPIQQSRVIPLFKAWNRLSIFIHESSNHDCHYLSWAHVHVIWGPSRHSPSKVEIHYKLNKLRAVLRCAVADVGHAAFLPLVCTFRHFSIFSVSLLNPLAS
ncbi:hypothetical protein BGW36DRAFT_65008 [Talaromyces proteolyticus]|uniref:Uncharacterized protein n=1 Tax=Talaromyces proteolyticus TaxID=1131652 RepID=A0AAD4PSZ3_9EURO|nr:uncharacterized protein BGW36DRAFT_65008 [Talaromyces proteolyticus]KAH8689934.1 hypothetical protein BGW36DRAFT_65008 [Talaromyces proteolyticus]